MTVTTDGIGSLADQMARLQHAADRHGLTQHPCPLHVGDQCGICGGYGAVFTAGDMTPCGPSCPLKDIRPV